MQRVMEPIAKRLRQSGESAVRSAAVASAKKPEDDLAAQIKRLEEELHSSESSSDEDDSDGDDGSDDDKNDGSSKVTGNTKKDTHVLSLSALANERVESLPEHLLPKASATAANLNDKKRKRPAKKDKTTDPPSSDTPHQSNHASLLDELQWPKRVPFACKPCAFVGKDMDEFLAHKTSAAHLANQGGKQLLTCKLCDKSFTSPHQLEEHKAGKWHQQRAQQRKARHVVKVCYDFIRGNCQWGDQCTFQHTETKAMKTGRATEKTKRRMCDAFRRSQRCRFGDKCLFSHAIES